MEVQQQVPMRSGPNDVIVISDDDEPAPQPRKQALAQPPAASAARLPADSQALRQGDEAHLPGRRPRGEP